MKDLHVFHGKLFLWKHMEDVLLYMCVVHCYKIDISLPILAFYIIELLNITLEFLLSNSVTHGFLDYNPPGLVEP